MGGTAKEEEEGFVQNVQSVLTRRRENKETRRGRWIS